MSFKRDVRYQVAIVEHDHIIMLKNLDPHTGDFYWLIPGGGREGDESEHDCVLREAREETCLEVAVERLLFEEPGIPDGAYERLKTYLCRIVSGEARAGSEPEVDDADFTSIHELAWFDLRDPASWPPLARTDDITNTLLLRIRASLGYR